MRTVAAFLTALGMVVVYATSGHLLAFFGMVAAAVLLAASFPRHDSDGLVEYRMPYRDEVQP